MFTARVAAHQPLKCNANGFVCGMSLVAGPACISRGTVYYLGFVRKLRCGFKLRRHVDACPFACGLALLCKFPRSEFLPGFMDLWNKGETSCSAGFALVTGSAKLRAWGHMTWKPGGKNTDFLEAYSLEALCSSDLVPVAEPQIPKLDDAVLTLAPTLWTVQRAVLIAAAGQQLLLQITPCRGAPRESRALLAHIIGYVASRHALD